MTTVFAGQIDQEMKLYDRNSRSKKTIDSPVRRFSSVLAGIFCTRVCRDRRRKVTRPEAKASTVSDEPD
jgi:hypothetical protein